MPDISEKSLLFISMLGENELFNPDYFKSLCSSGQERDWIVAWFGPMALEMGFSFSGIDICRGDSLPALDDFDCVILGGCGRSVNGCASTALQTNHSLPFVVDINWCQLSSKMVY